MLHQRNVKGCCHICSRPRKRSIFYEQNVINCWFIGISLSLSSLKGCWNVLCVSCAARIVFNFAFLFFKLFKSFLLFGSIYVLLKTTIFLPKIYLRKSYSFKLVNCKPLSMPGKGTFIFWDSLQAKEAISRVSSSETFTERKRMRVFIRLVAQEGEEGEKQSILATSRPVTEPGCWRCCWPRAF